MAKDIFFAPLCFCIAVFTIIIFAIHLDANTSPTTTPTTRPSTQPASQPHGKANAIKHYPHGQRQGISHDWG